MRPLMICNALQVILRVYQAKRSVQGSEGVDKRGQGVKGASRELHGAIRLV